MVDAPSIADLIAAVPLPALVINRRERIEGINVAAEGLIGKSAEGRHFVTILRQPTLVEAVERTLVDLKPRQARFLVGQGTAEQTFDVSLKSVGTDGKVLLCFQDISPLAHASQMRRDFVANVSHELRTPLTSLIGFIETLRGPAREDETARARFLEIMENEAGRMTRLIDDLLSLSRVESEARVPPRTRVDLTQVLQTTLRNLNPLAVDRDVVLKPQIGDEAITLLGDSDQLIQVFTNLIENAIKYGGAGQAVEVTTEICVRDPVVRGPSVRIHVTDHGPGIDPVHIPRLTERFYRADNHRSRALGGTGLGLAITKHILNRHRGRLKIASEIGQGAQFTVILRRESGEM